MRVIAGEFRSRRLKSMPGSDVRPTPDRLRETLFDILAPRIEGATFIDGYAGTGSVGIEALSRGARHAVFIERNADAAALIRENLALLGLTAKATVAKSTARSALARYHGDIIFIDPPYHLEIEYGIAMEAVQSAPLKDDSLEDDFLVIAQHSKHFLLNERFDSLVRMRQVKQSDNVLSFYMPESAPQGPDTEDPPAALIE